MVDDAEYICPACGGTGEVSFGHEDDDGEIVNEGTSKCWDCNQSGRVSEWQVVRHRLVVLARKLAERTIESHQETPLKQKVFALEGEQHGMGIETYTEVKTMELQGHFETDLGKLRPDLVETLFDLLAVPKPERWMGELGGGEEVPF